MYVSNYYFEIVINIFKYHVSCTDGKISVRINLSLLPTSPPSFHSIVVFYFLGLSLLSQHSQQVLLGVGVSYISWLGQLTVGVENVVIPTKFLQEGKTQLLNGTTVGK